MMKKGGFSNLILMSLVAIALCALLSGCSGKPKGADTTGTSFTTRQGTALLDKSEEPEELLEEEPQTIEEKLYIIEYIDTSEELIEVYSVRSKRELRYNYNLTTVFKDKYGKKMNVLKFVPGSVVVLGDLLPDSQALSSVSMAQSVWVYTELSNFGIDSEKGIFEINGDRYRLNDNTRVYSDDTVIDFNDISPDDVLTVTGLDKDIVSVFVTTGHGYIDLVNTELFVDSLIFIGPKIASMIEGDCKLEVPEGTYMVTVANDGWGGTKEVTITRNEITLVDLDELKGEGPKYCELSFEVLIDSCAIYLDGFKIDPNEVQEVRYGTHSLKVIADGYETWAKTLVVNSESATISLDMTAKNENNESVSTGGNVSGNTNNSISLDRDTISELANAIRGENTDNNDRELDYLSTLSNMISTIMD